MRYDVTSSGVREKNPKKDVKTVFFQNFVKKFVLMVLLRCIRISHYHVVLSNTSTLLCPLPYRRMISSFYASME